MLSSHQSIRAYLACFCIVLALAAAGNVMAGGVDPGATMRFDNPSWSPDGSRLALTDENRNSLIVYDAVDGRSMQVASSPSGGYAYNWSPDSAAIGFKQLIPAGQDAPPLQMPVYYRLDTQELIPLHAAVAQCGVPSFSADGQIAFTIGEELCLANATGKIAKRFPLGHYANLAPISPDGTQAAFNNADDQMWVLDLASGAKRPLTQDNGSYFGPVWSPDSSRLVVSTITGTLVCVELASGQSYQLDSGTTPSWSPDSKTVVYSRVDRLDGIRVKSATVRSIGYDGTMAAVLSADARQQAVAARIAPEGDKVAFVSLADGGVYTAPLMQAQKEAGVQAAQGAPVLGAATKLELEPAVLQETAAPTPSEDTLALSTESGGLDVLPADEPLPGQIVVEHAMPYIHQVYDTPDNFNGHWACGATSAMQVIGFYQKLPYWDVTCCCPSSHVSHYGRYISQIYSFNGHTYNIGSADASGNIAYGGYGYIVRNNWADTKGYMRDYFNNHGISSSVDWSPTWSEFQSEINAEHPFVVLNSLTSSGHYITAKGYYDTQHTGIFNDPYGNKNSGYMNYSGANVRYDWPGYNNGYSNLNTVHCFIYARASFPQTWAASYSSQSYPATMTAGSTATAWVQFTNNGSGHWTHCATKLGTSSPHDRTSPFCTPSNWRCADGSNPSCARPTDVDQSDVAQGATGKFTFILTAPSSPGTYTEKFQLVQEGVTWFGPEITWTITVTQTSGTLNGTVRNATNSAAIPGATVTLSGVGNATTNSSGVYTFSNVAAGSYTVSVSATGFNGASSPVSITAGQTTTKDFNLTPSDTEAPTIPTGLTANATGPTAVVLGWSASTDNVAVAGYDVRRNGAVIGSATGTSYTDNGATPASTFTYEVRARDAVPNYSGWSSPADATTPPNPPQTTTIFTDGFNGNMNNWTQGGSAYAYSTTVNHGTYTGAGAAFMGAGQADQMSHSLSKPFVQGKVWGYFYDGKGGWKAGVCGWSYRQCLSLRDIDAAALMYIDNAFYNAPDNSKYYFRTIGAGGIGYTTYATRNPNTSCGGAWIYFETSVTPGAPGASPSGTFVAKVSDGAGTTTTTQNLTTDFGDWGFGRITLGLAATSANEGYWDDIGFEAKPPDWPVMGAPGAISTTSITWNFSPRDNNLYGYDVADAGGTLKAPAYPASGWLHRNATSWVENGLTANTQYTRKVRGWNGTLNGAWSLTTSPWTLSVAPTAGSVTPDRSAVCTGDSVTWTAASGFGAGQVEYYKYAWNQSPTHAFTGSEPNWSSGTITTEASDSGTWYLHLQGYNGANVANGSYDYAVTADSQPTITQQPAGASLCPDAVAQFSVAANGTGPLTYQWQKDGGNLSNGGDISGADTATLQIAAAGADKAGNYSCVVTGACGSVVSDPAALALRVETTITQQPETQAVCQGGAVTLTVTADGEQPLTYQWQKNGEDLVGETAATFQIAAGALKDSGNYRCVVTGVCGSATSNEAEVVVAIYPSDFNADCHVDQADLALLVACTTGAMVAYDVQNLPEECDLVGDAEGILPPDFDRDGDIDMDDFGAFQMQLGTP